MLSESLKDEIQGAYSALLSNKGYGSRRCQKEMIAAIARTLGDVPDDKLEADNVCVVEAGTGTGKTIAYAIATIPIAKKLNKKIVIATATVALQEQIVYQDLPDIRQHSGLDFSFALAKGRRRYLCLSKLDLALQESGSVNHTLALFDNENHDAAQSDVQLFENMLSSLGRGDWDGDRDAWPQEIEPRAWFRVSTDHAQCTGRQCSHFDNCYFYRARESIHRVDCIVTNQDLVLADLMMGGGAVLPDPEETIYIFDEGHHLPDKAASHFSHFLGLYSTRSWLLQIPGSIAAGRKDTGIISEAAIGQVEKQIGSLVAQLDMAGSMLQQFQEQAEPQDDGWRFRFPRGIVATEVSALSSELGQSFSQIQALIESLEAALSDAMEDAAAGERDLIEQWLSIISGISARLLAGVGLWRNFAISETQPPHARWIKFSTGGTLEGMEIQLSSSPTSVAEELRERLWTRCYGAVVTSATLSVGKDFTSFQQRTGIHEGNQFVSLASPFNFRQQGRLLLPKMRSEPSQVNEHTAEIAELIPDLVSEDAGALVLFTSWKQMLAVLDLVDEDFRARVLCQGNLSKIEILQQHKQAIDNAEKSCIFGLASFSEGVDLPGSYCSHVVIAKIPFSVPDDPVSATLSELIEARGGNAFYEVMLPDAAIKMVQAAGRLLRTETDTGCVTILDRRLLTKSYGRILMNALPPFAREIR